jgi:hypothetical protein
VVRLSRMASSREEGAGPCGQDRRTVGKRAGGEEVEAAVEPGQGNRGLEFEGGESKLEVKARDGGEGDAEGGGERFVARDLLSSICNCDRCAGEWRTTRWERACTATLAYQRR